MKKLLTIDCEIPAGTEIHIPARTHTLKIDKASGDNILFLDGMTVNIETLGGAWAYYEEEFTLVEGVSYRYVHNVAHNFIWIPGRGKWRSSVTGVYYGRDLMGTLASNPEKTLEEIK